MRTTSIALSIGLGLGATLGGSCTPSNVFECGADEECVIAGIGGVCQPDGYCSFPANDCDSGQRYGEHAPPDLAGTCVGEGGSGTSDGPTSEGSQGTGMGPTTASSLDGTSDGGTTASLDSTSDDTTTGDPMGDALLLWLDFEQIGDQVVYDRSGNGRDAQCDDGPCPFPFPGAVGDGGGFKGNYLLVPYDPGLETPDALTIAVWVMVSPGASAMAIAEKPYFAESNPNWNSWELRVEDLLYFAIANDVEQSVALTMADNATPWVHLAGVYDGSTVTLYVDGKLADQAPASMPGFDTQDIIIGAGASDGVIDDYFVGVLDELRLYGRALSIDEIQALVDESPA